MPMRHAIRLLALTLCPGALLLLSPPATAVEPQPAPDPPAAPELAHPAAANPEEQSAYQARLLICKTRAALPPSKGGIPAEDIRRLGDAAGREVTPPQILFRIQPQYTEAARKQGIEGKVALESIIDEEGCVRDVKVLQSLDPGMDEVAKTVLEKWIFKPAMYQGKPVKVYYSLIINFALDKKEPSKPF